MTCPLCGEKLVSKKSPFVYGEIELGKYESEVCAGCGEVFFTEDASNAIDAKAKALGVWGLERRSKISYSGHSLMIRIPKAIEKFMALTKGANITIRPEGKKKLVVELGD